MRNGSSQPCMGFTISGDHKLQRKMTFDLEVPFATVGCNQLAKDLRVWDQRSHRATAYARSILQLAMDVLGR